MNKNVALITWAGLPEGAESEQLLAPHLKARGVEARMVDWRDASVDFSGFDLVVLRSCWDYHLRAKEFADWLERTAAVVPVLNDPNIVHWNSNKFYLQSLDNPSLRIAPTCFVSSNARLQQSDLSLMRGWLKAVVKPAVSASAHKTWLFEREKLPSLEKLKELMSGEDFLVQQFIPEIETQGEISFIYIDGEFSHAVLKRPAGGDFRVQVEHGGSAEPLVPPESLLRQADAIARAVPQVRESLYCRLDAVDQNGSLILMELELIEPELFLGLAEGAAKRFAEAITRELVLAS
jgi:glutathione synthase/RimK-type ligase-like ATP-grasp enzyme